MDPILTNEADRHTIERVWKQQWSGAPIVSRGHSHFPGDVHGIRADIERDMVGLATFVIRGGQCELVSLNSFQDRRGVGTRLLKAVAAAAKAAGCRRVWLTTTNDNTDALRFYQRHGYDLVALRLHAVDEARRIKPSIPATGAHDIPIRHEIELERVLE